MATNTDQRKSRQIHISGFQDLLGGNVRMIASGSAPLSDKVASFIKCVMGCPVSPASNQDKAPDHVLFKLADATVLLVFCSYIYHFRGTKGQGLGLIWAIQD